MEGTDHFTKRVSKLKLDLAKEDYVKVQKKLDRVVVARDKNVTLCMIFEKTSYGAFFHLADVTLPCILYI